MLDKTGRPKARMAKVTACRRAAVLLVFVASMKHPRSLTAEILKPRVQDSTPGIENHVPTHRQMDQFVPHCFSHTSLDPIANNCAAQGARECESYSARILPRFLPAKAKRGKEARTHS
jgi:hypothetical protein